VPGSRSELQSRSATFFEFVRHEETGLVSTPDAAAIAKTFDRLWEDRDAAARWGEAGNRLLLQRVPAWPDVVEQLLG